MSDISHTYFWHYTSAEGLHAIKRDKLILPSNGQYDARYGPGVYLTRLPPHNPTAGLTSNNWDSSGRGDESKTYCYVRVLQSQLPEAQQMKNEKRDVWKVPGAINLRTHHHEFGQRAGTGNPGPR